MILNGLPGPMGQKNMGLSPAVSDLGLGDALVQQMQDKAAEKRKLNPDQLAMAQSGSSMMSPAVMALLGKAQP